MAFCVVACPLFLTIPCRLWPLVRHFILQRLPADVLPGPIVSIAGREVESLRCDPASIPPFAVSFEEAGERIAALAGAYVEPDGSFSLLVAPHAAHSTPHTFGLLYDRGGALLYVELRTDCPAAALSVIIPLLGETARTVMTQLPEQGVWLSVERFTSWLEN